MGDRQRINNIMRALQEGTESVRRNPSEQNYRKALSDIERAGKKSNFWSWVIGWAILGGIALNAFNGSESQPRVNITDLDIYHNVSSSSGKNIKMVLDFDTANIKNYSCTAIAYFYYKNGIKVRSNILGYRTRDGQLSSSKDFRPRYEDSKDNNLTLYIPNKYFRPGSYKVDVTTYCGNKFLGNTKTFNFTKYLENSTR
ncbi:hypothetical protein [Okeania sp. SIO2B3]|uniref:hypothetical protein n=1 Tax=Okeania sp. SIO2B3 TaxID=2607784 RepID=UPI0013C10F4E|nr:hypothetical protein [Okeania sp. SIO2B3]NET45492.1 hypothetical protein [Okeania sp. SIO2B3]